MMPTIAITSDLHLGITAPKQIEMLAEEIAAAQPDLTILAGDLGAPLGRFRECLALFADVPGARAVLAGNHDVWAHGQRSQDLWERLLPEATRAAGMLWLEDADWRQDGCAVAGSLAWYDYSAADPGLPPFTPAYYAIHKRDYNNDGTYIDWPWSDVDFAARLGDGLCARLDALEADATIQKVLVVTHVPICEAQLVRKPDDQRWGFSNAYFGNLTLGRRVAAHRKVRAIISGHTHTGCAGQQPHLPQPSALPPIEVAVIPSDYNRPAYMLITMQPDSAKEIET
jgi:hypothetical protein